MVGRVQNTNVRFDIAREGVILLLLLILVIVSFGRVPSLPFLDYDDPSYVTENPQVLDGMSLSGLAWAARAVVVGNWQPVAVVSHQLDATLYGKSPYGHHLTNLLLHLVNVGLLFWVLRSMTGAVWRSALVAALFAVHPLHVQSVAWVSARKDVLSTLFWLLTMQAYAFFVKKPGRARYALLTALFALGLMTKPMLVTLPCVLLLLDYWPLERYSSEHMSPRQWCVQAWPFVREKLPLFGLSLATAVIAVFTQKSLGALGSAETYPMSIRLSNVVMGYALYLYKMIWPAGLTLFYPHPHHVAPALQLLGAVALFVAITGCAFRYGRRFPYAWTGWFWYVITLLPVIGLVQVGGQSMADRYSYVPYTGVFIALAWGLADIAGQAMRTRVIASVLCVAMLLVCAYRTWVEVSYWRDSETLWERSLAVTTDNFPAHLNLALLDVRQKRRESAAKHLEAALRIAPYDTIALNDYGLVLLELGRYSEAAEQFELALRSLPGDAKLHIAMAVALEKQGKRSEAIQQMNEAHRLDPSMDVKSILNKTLRAVDAAKL